MKLSIRLTLYTVSIAAMSILLCCIILLVTTANSQINKTIDNGIAELRMLQHSFSTELNIVGDTTLSGPAQRSLVQYIFRKYVNASVSGAYFVLMDDTRTLYNDSTIDPRPLLQDMIDSDTKDHDWDTNAETDLPATIVELDGGRYLATGQFMRSLGGHVGWDYTLYLVRDISGVYADIRWMGIQFGVIALITVLLSAVVMVFLIRRAIRPLNDLAKNAAALADGRYDDRIHMQRKDEISHLANSFNRMADAVSAQIHSLENTSEQRKVLLGALTHELKTPMTAIIGYSESLLRANLSSAQREKALLYINSECKRIERLSQKMMHLITLHGGEEPEMRLQPVQALYETVEQTLREIAAQENIRVVFTKEGDPIFSMDIDMMANVLINLFDNARKAGAHTIKIHADAQSLSVLDDGQGIPAEEISKITQPFYMVDKSHSQSIGGSGLGLALCELIVDLHHALLKIESKCGKGTTVSINFQKLQTDNTLMGT